MAKREMARNVGAGKCIAALQTRFKAPEFAFFEQVANATGVGAGRWADAVAMGIWPSRGLEIHGFEVKVSRSDFKHEIDQPEKAEAIQKYCDRWHIVAPRGMLDTHELPPTWGLLEVSEDGKLATRVAAPELTPVALTKQFVAAILRRQAETWHAALDRAKTEAYNRGVEKGPEDLNSRLERAQRQHKELFEAVDKFHAASGINIHHAWNIGQVGEAVRLLTNEMHRTSYLEMAMREIEAHRNVAKRIEDEIRAVQKIVGAGSQKAAG